MNRQIIMGVLELKRELQKMTEQENDVNILKALRTILEKTTLDPVLKKKSLLPEH